MSSISKKSFKHHNNTDFFKSKFKILLLKQPLLASLLMVMCSPQLSFSQSMLSFSQPKKVASTPLKSYLYAEQPTKQNQQELDKKIPLPIEWQKFSRKADNDLLTAGLTLEGLQSHAAPGPKQSRQLAYYTNIRALLDTTTEGGFGRLYGPKPKQIITGVEYLAETTKDYPLSPANFSVQIPDSFNVKQPCLIVAPSSGSRGIYGAVGVSGFWALDKGCAIAYTDKGTGTGFYFVGLDKTFDLTGQLHTPNTPIDWVNADNNPDKDRLWVATRHAHSGNNPEKDWGQHTLLAAKTGLFTLTDHFKQPFNSDNTLVIAASISNGGSAVLRAVEQDTHGLIDAVVSGEPNVSVDLDVFEVQQSNVNQTIKPLHALESFLLQSVFAPCANLAALPDTSEVAVYRLQAELACKQLLNSHLLETENLDEAARQAQTNLLKAGLSAESLWLGPIYTSMGLWPALEATYPSSYARLKLFDDPCGAAFEVPASSPITTNGLTQLAKIWPLSSGIPPTAGVVISPYTPLHQTIKPLQSFNQKMATSLCYLAWLKADHQKVLGLEKQLTSTLHNQLKQGMTETYATANLQGKPAIIVHGRSDRLIQVNHSSRPYFWLNKTSADKNSQLRYIEITNAQHFDALLPYPPFNSQLIPLHVYFEKALEAIYQNQTNNTPLPDSVVVKTQKRQFVDGTLEHLTETHLPSFSDSSEAISWTEKGLKLAH
jgi:hydroxybutyrate-dimer hydrolase